MRRRQRDQLFINMSRCQGWEALVPIYAEATRACLCHADTTFRLALEPLDSSFVIDLLQVWFELLKA